MLVYCFSGVAIAIQETALFAGSTEESVVEAFEVIVNDPCTEPSYMNEKTDAFTALRRVGGETVIKVLGWLLYFDDARPSAYKPASGCYPTSVFAAGGLRSIARGEKTSINHISEESYRREVQEMKVWWEDHADEYGVSDPRNPFSDAESELDLAISDSMAAVDLEATGAETEAQRATEDAEPKPEEAKPSDAESERPWALLTLLGALLLAAIGWLAFRSQRSG